MSKPLYIEAVREGYSIEQCENTFTVRDFIDYLRQFPMDAPVYISNDHGYTFSSVSENNCTDPYDY